MPITRVGLIEQIDQASSTTHAYTVGASGVSQGSFVVLRCGTVNAGRTMTGVVDSKGNTYTLDVNDSTTVAFIASGYISTALVNGDTITVTIDVAATFMGDAVEYTGIVSSGALDQTKTNSNGVSTSWTTTATAPTTQADELCVAMARHGADIRSTPEGTWTEESDFRAATTGRSMVTQYKIVSATGAYSGDGTWDSATGSTASIATYRGGSTPITGLRPAICL